MMEKSSTLLMAKSNTLCKKRSRSPLILGIAALLWLVLVTTARIHFSNFENTAGIPGHPPQWQKSGPYASNSSSGVSSVKPRVIMLVHPQCPCSEASLYELNRLAALCPNQAAITVLFLRPAGFSLAWTKSRLWQLAAAIPGVSVRVDERGKIARRFGVSTSGETVVYAPDGRLLYEGGLTGARGHEGDNAGLVAVMNLLRKPTANGESAKNGPIKQPTQEPVYGCPMTANRRSRAAGGLSWLL